MNFNWNGGSCCASPQRYNFDDVGFLNQVISDALAKYPIDKEKIYMAGFSSGAQMTYRYACEGAHALAGISSISGTGREWEHCVLRTNTPIITIREYADLAEKKQYAAQNIHT